MAKQQRQPVRSTGGAFSESELRGFLAGDWADVGGRSGNVASARWDAEREVLTLRFKDGSGYDYAPVDRGLAIDFANAPSKGGWRYDHFPKGARGVIRISD